MGRLFLVAAHIICQVIQLGGSEVQFIDSH